jgi:hypothetical protein
MLQWIAESLGVVLLRRQYQHFKKNHAKKYMCSHIITKNVLGRKTYCHIYGNEPATCNPPESVPESITCFEILFSKPVMHIYPCIMMPGYTLHIIDEEWLVPVYRTYCTWSTEKTAWSIRYYWLPGNYHDCPFLNKGISQKVTKEILAYQPCVQVLPQAHTTTHTHAEKHTNTHKHTRIHCSSNGKQSGVSEFLHFHKGKVPSNTSNP